MGGNKVLESTRCLIEEPSYVMIHEQNLEAQAIFRINWEDLKIPTWEIPVYVDGHDNDTIDFFMLGNSLNFAFSDFETFTKFTAEYNGMEWRGSMGMWASLKKALENGIPILEGEYLKHISKEEVSQIFKGNIEIPMLHERFEILREVGKVLVDCYNGHFYNLVNSTNRLFDNGKGLVEKLTSQFPSFDDSVEYEGRLIRFDKRAQLAPAMLYGRFQGTDRCQFEDIDDLTVFADYVLPNTLRAMGILKYHNKLAARIDNKEVIPAYSKEEMQIRAATIHASKMLVDRVNELRNDKINSLHMDYRLWSIGREICKDPHHLTKTIAY